MYLIIGQGAAGTAAAKELKRREPAAEVMMLCAERRPFYNRISMPEIVAGRVPPDDLTVHGEQFFADAGIACRLGVTAAGIDAAAHTVLLDSGERITYRKLLLATGSLPLLPPIADLQGPDVYSLWTAEDAEAIRDRAARSGSARIRSAVVLGAGFIGLKTALALNDQGIAVTVVEKLPRVMPRQLDAGAAAIIAGALAAKGIALRTGMGATAVIRDKDAVRAVKLEDGSELPCGFVIAAMGVIPNAALARTAGIATRRGILIDACGRTSDPDIYAAGDVTEVAEGENGEGRVQAIWPAAVDQGKAAAAAMTGAEMPAPSLPPMNSVELAGIPLASMGDIAGGPGDEVRVTQKNNAYRRVVLRGDVPRGILCLGDIARVGVLGNLIMRQAPLPGCDPAAAHFNFGNLLFPAEENKPPFTEDAHANT